MIYVDSSVVLAHVLAEDVAPPDELWSRALITSRLTTYETWTRVHARGLGASHGDALQDCLSRLALVETVPATLSRALEPWPRPIRTLDALHLATLEFLRQQGQNPEIACYDLRLLRDAERLGFRAWNAG